MTGNSGLNIENSPPKRVNQISKKSPEYPGVKQKLKKKEQNVSTSKAEKSDVEFRNVLDVNPDWLNDMKALAIGTTNGSKLTRNQYLASCTPVGDNPGDFVLAFEYTAEYEKIRRMKSSVAMARSDFRRILNPEYLGDNNIVFKIISALSHLSRAQQDMVMIMDPLFYTKVRMVLLINISVYLIQYFNSLWKARSLVLRIVRKLTVLYNDGLSM